MRCRSEEDRSVGEAWAVVWASVAVWEWAVDVASVWDTVVAWEWDVVIPIPSAVSIRRCQGAGGHMAVVTSRRHHSRDMAVTPITLALHLDSPGGEELNGRRY